jgi:threonine dehydrogenase-like Zn-dependent dehydrogenase
LAHGGRYILIGLQKETLIFSHPEFHKRESTLMSSRNATRKDFEQVIDAIKKGLLNPSSYIDAHIPFDELGRRFKDLPHDQKSMIKVMIDM